MTYRKYVLGLCFLVMSSPYHCLVEPKHDVRIWHSYAIVSNVSPNLRDSWLELLACYMHVDCVSLTHAIEPANWPGYQLVQLNTTELECTHVSNLKHGFVGLYIPRWFFNYNFANQPCISAVERPWLWLAVGGIDTTCGPKPNPILV